MSLISRGLEVEGIPSVLVSVMEPLSSPSRPPRQLLRKLNIGATVGRPGDAKTQLETLRRMVALLSRAQAPGAIDRDVAG